jgi:hypothetical protein
MAKKKNTDGDESNENLGNQNDSDDTFGLPEIEYKPLNRDEESSATTPETQPAEVTQPESQYIEQEQKPMEQAPEYAYEPEEESAPVWPKVLGILLVILLAGGAAWYFIMYKPAQEKERLAKEKLEQEAAKKEQDRLAAEQRLRDEAEQKRLDSLANISKVGAFEVLSERTRRYYVIVASAVDDDLLIDFSKKLSAKGVSSKLIPPFAKYKFFRLAIADGDTFAATQEMANAKKAEYGDALWVLKY